MSSTVTETRDDISVRVPEGWWQTNNAAQSRGWPDNSGSWAHLISATYNQVSGEGYWALQIAGGFFDNDHFYVRKTNANGLTPWRELWHTGNLNPDSKASLSGADFWGPVTTKGLEATPSSQVNKKYIATFNPDAVVIGAGNSVSFAPEGSSILGPRDGPYNGQIMPRFWDHQRTSLLVSATTALDAAAQEQAIAITFNNTKGEITPYAPNTYYSVGQNIRIPRNDSEKQEAVYRCIQAGTTGANSAPPGWRPYSDSDADFILTDGSVRWLWINDFATNAKVGQYIEVKNKPGGGGNAWGFCVNSSLEQGFKPGFVVAQEINLFNDSGIDANFGTDIHGLSIAMMGPNFTSSALSIGTPDTPNQAGSRWGIRMSGPHTVREAAIALDVNSRYGIATNQFSIGGGNFQEAFIFDRSTSNTSIEVSGTKRVATFMDVSNSPTSLNVIGSKSFAGIYEHSTTPVGIKLLGDYRDFAIQANGFTVTPWGDIRARTLLADGVTTTQGYGFSNDNAQDIGSPSARARNLYLANNNGVGSDRNLKTPLVAFSNEQLDKWSDVRFGLFQYLASVAEKGADHARIHAGVIAQDVVAALGEDAFRYGLVGRDLLTKRVVKTRTVQVAKTRPVEVSTVVDSVEDGKAIRRTVTETQHVTVVETLPLWDADGNPVMVHRSKEGGASGGTKTEAYELVQETITRPVMEAFEQEYEAEVPDLDETGEQRTLHIIRYEQLLVWEAAYQRREMSIVRAGLSQAGIELPVALCV